MQQPISKLKQVTGISSVWDHLLPPFLQRTEESSPQFSQWQGARAIRAGLEAAWKPEQTEAKLPHQLLKSETHFHDSWLIATAWSSPAPLCQPFSWNPSPCPAARGQRLA